MSHQPGDAVEVHAVVQTFNGECSAKVTIAVVWDTLCLAQDGIVDGEDEGLFALTVE